MTLRVRNGGRALPRPARRRTVKTHGGMEHTPCAGERNFVPMTRVGEGKNRGQTQSRGTEKASSRVRRVYRTENASGAMKHASRAPASGAPQNGANPRRDERHLVPAMEHTSCARGNTLRVWCTKMGGWFLCFRVGDRISGCGKIGN